MKKVILSTVAIMFVFVASISAQTWQPVTSTGTTFILYGMHFPAGQNDIGYACGMQYTYNADGVIVKTTNGGDTWTQIWPASGTIDGLQGIWFINDTVGFACGWNNYFIKTTDGGSSWSDVTVGSDVWYYKDVEFWDENNGVACASMNSTAQSVFITSDGGTTWTPSTSGMATNATMGLCYAAEDTLYAVDTDNKVQWSTDGGHNWTTRKTLSAMLFGVDFANSSFGVVGGEEEMFATNDGGLTWTTYTTGYENFYGAKAYANGTAYIGGTDQNIYKTTDYGATWTMDNDGTTSSIYRIRESDDGSLFSSASQGSILTKAAPLSADFEADQTTICAGSTVNFTDLSIAATSWSWVFEGGTPATSADQNPSVTYSTAGNYDVTLTASDDSGSETEIKINYISVVVLPVQANTPEGDTGVCLNNSYEYTTVVVNYASAYDWELSPADAGILTGDGNTANLITDEEWTGDFTIRVRATNVCGDGNWSDNLECSLSEAPEIFLLSEGGEYCNGDETGVEITQDNSAEGVDYELFLDDVTTGTTVEGTGSEISYGFFTDEGNYTATGTEGGCSSYMEGTAVITIAYEPDPAAVPTGDTTVCSGTTTDYSVTPIVGADTIYWMLTPSEAGTVIGSGEEISIEWDIDFNSYAYLSAQGENACGLGEESDELEINCSQSPSPEITGSDMVCKEEEADYSTADNAGNTYEWTVAGGTISAGEGTHQITVLWGAPGNGTVDLIESTEGSCVGSAETFEVTIDDCIGIDEDIEENLSIYPNPATDVINIQSENVIKSIKLMDLTGREIVNESNYSKTYQLSAPNLKPGVYLLVIEMEKTIVKRVVIE